MADDAHTLAFGVTFDMVAARTAPGRLLSLTSHRGDAQNPPHRHASDYICIVLAGSFVDLQEGRCSERRTGSFFAHEAGETHHDRFGPKGARCLNLHFAPEMPRPGRIEGRCSASAKVAADKLAFALAARSDDELIVASLTAELIAEIQSDETGPRDGGAWIERIVEAISDEPGRRWSLRDLAGIANRHPVHMAQAFRARTGMSLGAFQRLRRLTSLSLALRHERGSLARLAAEFGYCDQSHMNAEFRAAFGTSPDKFRRSLH